MRMPGAASLVWLSAAAAAASIIVAAAPLPRLLAGDSGVPAAAPPIQPGAASPKVSLDPILELSPFGRLVRAATGAPDVQETSLGLILHGIVIAVPPENSTAIISGAGEPARVFRIGAEIAAGASLTAVHVDRVELLVDGTPETLSFPDAGQPDAEGPAEGEGDFDALRQMIAGEAAEYTAATDVAVPDAAPEGDSVPETIADRIERYRKALRDNPQMLLDELGLAAFEDGYRVSMTVSDEVRSTGLLPGDVISTVNGQQVGVIERDAGYFDEVIASGRATLEAIREGERVVMVLPLR